MPARQTDLLLGAILVVVASLWCIGVVATIPALDDGSRLGARGFPLALGILLGCLGLIVFVKGFVSERHDINASATKQTATPFGVEVWAILATVSLLAGYSLLMEYAGFIIATLLIVAVAIGPVLGIWKPRLIAGMSIGLSLGIYLIFGKLLGVYLPYGKLINIAF
jgi:putative tricarboxylic transport membrane protein